MKKGALRNVWTCFLTAVAMLLTVAVLPSFAARSATNDQIKSAITGAQQHLKDTFQPYSTGKGKVRILDSVLWHPGDHGSFRGRPVRDGRLQ